MLIPILISILAAATARPSYIAVPADQIAFVDLRNAHVRVPRQTLVPPPPPPQQPVYDEEYMPIEIQGLQSYQIPQYQHQQQPLNLVPIGTPNQPIQQAEPEQAAQLSHPSNDRPPDFGEYVDFGAHTGDNGAFGWYADFPILHTQPHAHDSIGFR